MRRAQPQTFLSCLQLLGIVLAAQLAPIAEVHGQAPADPVDLDQIRQLSLEELMSIDVTTIAGLPEEWFRTPAAMTVLTADDLRRAGHRSLPEALRLVPGMLVGHQSSMAWRLGARGFTGAALPTPRNLVLIDGRSVYDPLYGGVNWDVQDVVLDDIERIEVIRGPGATLWGPNAVSGVINVITKSARETAGTSVSGGTGSYEEGFGTVRHGARVGDDAWLRVYGKHFARDHLLPPAGRAAADNWSMLRSGFRLDVNLTTGARFTVQGDVYDSPGLGSTSRLPIADAHMQFESVTDDYFVSGGNILARMGQAVGSRGSWSLQAYYDRTHREVLDGFEVDRNTADLDFRNDVRLNDRNQLVWGVGYRHSGDRATSGRVIELDPGERSLNLFSGFVQHTTEFVPGKVQGMVGSKLTKYTFTGWEAQPSARLWWTPDDRQTVWCAASRTVRHPTRLELDGRFILAYVDSGLYAGGASTGVYVPLTLDGDQSLGSERLVTYELGYRARPGAGFTVDAAFYFNDYSRLISIPPAALGAFNDDGYGESYGVETALSWRAAPNWRLHGGYSYTEVRHRGPVLQGEERYNPKHLAHLRSELDVHERLELNSAAYYVGVIPLLGIPSYVRLDAGATWRAGRGLSLAVWGQNLLDPGIRELSQSEFPRGVYVQGSLLF